MDEPPGAPVPLPRKPARARAPRVLLGVALTGLLHLVALGVTALLDGAYVMYFVGVVQVVYVLPVWGVLLWKRKTDLALGVVIGAAVSFLLTPFGCFAAFGNL